MTPPPTREQLAAVGQAFEQASTALASVAPAVLMAWADDRGADRNKALDAVAAVRRMSFTETFCLDAENRARSAILKAQISARAAMRRESR